MNLAPTDDERAIAEAFSDLFEAEATPQRVKAAAEDRGHDDRLWQQLTAIGAPGIAVAEQAGGAGAGFVSLSLALEHGGRRLAPAPLAEVAVAARLLERCGATAELGRALGGEIVAFAPRPARHGVFELVPAGAIASLVVGLAGDRLIASATSPERTAPVANLAQAPLADHRTEAAEDAVLAAGEEAHRLFSHSCDDWRAANASLLCGLALGAMALGVEYVSARRQFGRPIGAFQAVQHGLAESATASEGARLLARKAAWAIDRGLAEAAQLAAMAYAFAAENAVRTAARALHYHGGYGFTLEYEIQMYVRRAGGWSLAAGDPRREWSRVAALARRAASQEGS